VFKRYRLRSNQKLRMFIKEGKPNNDVFSSLIKDSVLWDEIWDEEWTYDILELVNSKVEDCEEGSAAHKILVRNVTKKIRDLVDGLRRKIKNRIDKGIDPLSDSEASGFEQNEGSEAEEDENVQQSKRRRRNDEDESE